MADPIQMLRETVDGESYGMERHHRALAQVEALVEAALLFEPIPDKWSNGDQRDRLRAALAPFKDTT